MKLLPLLTSLDEPLMDKSKEPFYLRPSPGIAGQMGNKGNRQFQKSAVNLSDDIRSSLAASPCVILPCKAKVTILCLSSILSISPFFTR